MKIKRNTIQRRLIYNAVKDLNIHATADQVFEFVKNDHPNISRATVYRNLSHMEETGELMCVSNPWGAAHYDHNCHSHYHFICEKCGRVFDVDGFTLEIDSGVAGMDGFMIKRHSLIYNGLCPECK